MQGVSSQASLEKYGNIGNLSVDQMRQRRWMGSAVAHTLIVVLLLAYGVSLLVGQVSFLEKIALVPHQNERWWATLTYPLGHVSLLHLIGNIAFVYLGVTVSSYYLSSRNLIGFVVAALLATGAIPFFFGDPSWKIVGASGFGTSLCMLALALSLHHRAHWSVMIYPAVCFGLIVSTFAISLASTDGTKFAWSAHAAGLVVGLALAGLGMLLSKKTTPSDQG